MPAGRALQEIVNDRDASLNIAERRASSERAVVATG